MAIAPRLDLRQSQTLVMTPQLRQAIKLLQFSNIEVNSFVEEEMERNPLLERDDAPEPPVGERAALDQIEPRSLCGDGLRRCGAGRHVAGAEAGSPLDAMHAETYDPGGAGDGAPLVGRMDGGGGSHSFEGDDRGIDDFAGDDRSLRDHLGEQLRLNFTDPVDRMIGAHLIALLCPAGRLTAEPTAIAMRDGAAAGAGRGGSRSDDAVRSGGSVRARSEGVPGGSVGGTQPARSGDADCCWTTWICWPSGKTGG